MAHNEIATALQMDPGIRTRWVTALRSGEYKQGHGKLRMGNKFCCLGVLCDLAVKDGLGLDVNHRGSATYAADTYAYGGEFALLPAAVAQWAGFDQPDGNAWTDVPELGRVDLASLNDDGWSFARIADAIEGVTA